MTDSHLNSPSFPESAPNISASGGSVKREERGFWYFITTVYCPICGSAETDKERRFTPRPAAFDERHKTIEAYDHCDD